MTTQNTIGFYSVKIISIFIISIIYVIVGSVTGLLLNNSLPEKEKIEKLSTFSLICLICSIFGIISIIYYFIRRNIKRIPFFLDGVYGFKYELLKEASGGIIFAFILYNYLDKLKMLLQELKHRIYNKLDDK
jgi:hypothetical protein